MTTQALAELNAELAEFDDPTEYVLALCEAGLRALNQATSLDDATHVLAAVSTIEHATKMQRLSGEACIAASVLRIRAERRVGQFLIKDRAEGRLAGHGGRRFKITKPDLEPTPTLADHGVGPNQSAEFGRLARTDDETFDAAVEQQAERAKVKGGLNVTRSGVLRSIDPEAEKSGEQRCDDVDRFLDACQKATALADAFAGAVRFGSWPWALTGEQAGDQFRQRAERILAEAAAAIEQARTEMRRKP